MLGCRRRGVPPTYLELPSSRPLLLHQLARLPGLVQLHSTESAAATICRVPGRENRGTRRGQTVEHGNLLVVGERLTVVL